MEECRLLIVVAEDRFRIMPGGASVGIRWCLCVRMCARERRVYTCAYVCVRFGLRTCARARGDDDRREVSHMSFSVAKGLLMLSSCRVEAPGAIARITLDL